MLSLMPSSRGSVALLFLQLLTLVLSLALWLRGVVCF